MSRFGFQLPIRIAAPGPWQPRKGQKRSEGPEEACFGTLAAQSITLDVVEQNHNGIGKLMVPAFQIHANIQWNQ